MELPRRKPDDILLPDGTLSKLTHALRLNKHAHDLRIGIVYAFDFRTHMLPYWYVDKRMAPCSVRTLADLLNEAGFKHVRIVLQQWTPNFRPSEAVLDGRPLDILLVSAMQVHAEPSYELIREAHRLGEARPLVIAGGPKAIYEPTHYFELGPTPGVGADCVVTGEAFVLLDLLNAMLEYYLPGESARTAFDRARQSGVLKQIPGLVYLSPEAEPGRPVAISTGVQRLLRDLDELPMPDAGYRLLEPAHRGTKLSPRPYPAHRVRRRSIIASLLATQGCKFNCSYCPIPAANQRTWRHKSPERFAEEIRHIHENFGIREFFGTDDNFFNRRETVIDLMTAMAPARTSDGRWLAKVTRFYTEGTQFDVYKNRDLLPLCRAGGLRAIWFGVEDITAELINKGQNAAQTAELFALMTKLRIEPMVMMIHHDDQPLRSPPGTLAGLINQAKYVFDIGAVSYQCTYLGPAVGTRDIEKAACSGVLYKSVGGEPVPQAFQDGNHVVSSKHDRPWEQELNLLRAYWTFYNPRNMLRVLWHGRPRLWGAPRDPLLAIRFGFQVVGCIGLAMTAPKILDWARKLKRGPIEVYDGLTPADVPMVDAETGEEIQWAVEHTPTPWLRSAAAPAPDGGSAPGARVSAPEACGIPLPVITPA